LLKEARGAVPVDHPPWRQQRNGGAAAARPLDVDQEEVVDQSILDAVVVVVVVVFIFGEKERLIVSQRWHWQWWQCW
jgi:hypothetical protein